jgi:hypothetical protein
MTAILMNEERCDIAHEALLLEEFGNAVRYAPVPDANYHSVLMEVIDSVMPQRAKAFPKCP